MKVRDVIKLIEEDGWFLVVTKGSHRQYKHLTKLGRVTIAGHLKLVESLIHKLRQTDIAERKILDWYQLYGLGKGLWEGEDAQEYVNKLREERA
jgi:predicted RNA binding protein YcfA (HicA-like mRNA interferase family)